MKNKMNLNKMFLISSILFFTFFLYGCPALEPLGFPPTTDRSSEAYHDWKERESERREHAIEEANLKVEHDIEIDMMKEEGWEFWTSKVFPRIGTIVVEHKRGLTIYMRGAGDPSWMPLPEETISCGTWYYRVENKSPFINYVKITFEHTGYMPNILGSWHWVRMLPGQLLDWGYVEQYGDMHHAVEAHNKITEILVKTEEEYLNTLKTDSVETKSILER
jgi:hypothetical protein